MKKVITIIIAIITILILGSLLLSSKDDADIINNKLDVATLKEYRNEQYGYRFFHVQGWEEREKDIRGYFHSSLNNTSNLSEIDIDWNTYRQVVNTSFLGNLEFVNRERRQDYLIDHYLYENTNNLTLKQWYDLFVLAEALYSRRITEGEFIRVGNYIIDKEVSLNNELNLYDPWAPRGKFLEINNRPVLKAIFPGDYRYNGYQYYIAAHNNYFLVFRFGYGGLYSTREMWKENDANVKIMLKTIGEL